MKREKRIIKEFLDNQKNMNETYKEIIRRMGSLNLWKEINKKKFDK